MNTTTNPAFFLKFYNLIDLSVRLVSRRCCLLGTLLSYASCAVSHGQIYVPDRNSGVVKKANFDGTGLITLINSGLSLPFGIDVTNSNIYITNMGTNGTDGTVTRFDSNGGNPVTLVTGLPNPYDVETNGNSMYVSMQAGTGDLSEVRKYDLNGVVDNSFTPIAGLRGSSHIESTSTNLFITSPNGGQIVKCNLNGTGSSIIISGLNGVDGFSNPGNVVISGGYLYVLRLVPPTLLSVVAKYDLSGNVINDQFITASQNMSDIAAAGTQIYILSGNGYVDEYEINTGNFVRSHFGLGGSGLAVLGAPDPLTVTIAQYAGLTITGTIGASYTIEYTTNGNDPASWQPLDTINLPSSPYLYFDTSPISGSRLYRIAP